MVTLKYSDAFVAMVTFNSLAPARYSSIINHVIFKHRIVSDIWNSLSEVSLSQMPTGVTDDNFGSGSGLVSPGNKLLPEPMLA